MTTNPALSALLDQGDAAGAHAVATMHNLAALQHTTVRNEPNPGPITRGIIARTAWALVATVSAGGNMLCDHLSFTAPTVAFTAASAADKLRCGPCFSAHARAMVDTPEDSTCDCCRQVVDVMHSCAVQMPALVVDNGAYGLPGAIPPTIITFGLCPKCLAVDRRTT